MVELDLAQPVMLVDTSYFIFYRYFAVFNWYKLAKKTTVDVPTILENEQFMEKFDKLFEENLERLRKKHGVALTNVVFVKDCMRDHIWRFKYYAQYKKSRDEKLTTFNGDIFKYCYNTLMPRLEAKLGVQSCEHPCSEADDIIAVFARSIYATSPTTRIVIVTNDNDYLQLINESTTLVNMKNVDLKSRLTTEPLKYLEIKIIMGDKSDNIPSVFSKCGEKKAHQLCEDADALNERLSKSEETKARYNLNRLLIDMRCIPDDIQDEIRTMLQVR